MYGMNHFKSLHGYNFTLADGRTFNAHGKNAEDAIAELKDYLFCEYDEHEVNIASIEQYCAGIVRSHNQKNQLKQQWK